MTTLETYAPLIIIGLFVVGHVFAIVFAIQNMRKGPRVSAIVVEECGLHKWVYAGDGKLECKLCQFRAGS